MVNFNKQGLKYEKSHWVFANGCFYYFRLVATVKELSGPCFTAAQYRQEAGKARTDGEKKPRFWERPTPFNTNAMRKTNSSRTSRTTTRKCGSDKRYTYEKWITLSAILNVKPEIAYKAWLNGKEHSNFTGSPAKINPKVGGTFTAWDGYISGKTMELEPNKRILQKWRTTEFPDKSPDSMLEITFENVDKGN